MRTQSSVSWINSEIKASEGEILTKYRIVFGQTVMRMKNEW